MSRKYGEWIARHQDQVWSLARYLLGDAMEAEDAAQEAFLRLWQQREPFDDQAVKPWLLTVTRNLCLDRLRKRPRLEPVDGSAADDGAGPQESLSQAELAARLRLEIERLAEPYRSLVVLRDMQQHSYAEVAAITGLNLAQVKVYLHRARGQLRENLFEMET